MRPHPIPSIPHPTRLLALALARALAVCALALGPLVASAQTPTAQYQVVFEATWSAATHPANFPSSPHFSPLVGGTHDSNVAFWLPGGLASPGIERMAELGSTSTLIGEIAVEIANGFADQTFTGSTFGSPGTDSITITVDRDFPQLTLVSMIAPSPDWFVGVHGLPLFEFGWWVPEVEIDLFVYDAGTDHGPLYQSPNQDADPQAPIALLGAPLEPGVPVGTFTITRLPEPGAAMSLLVGGCGVALLARRRRRFA